MRNQDLVGMGVINVHEAVKICGNIGLWPWKGQSSKDFITLALYAKYNGYDLSHKGGVAVGFDKTCENECMGKFTSLDGVADLPWESFNKAINMKTNNKSDEADLLIFKQGMVTPAIWRKA